jgi:hypothetical protein
MSKAHRLAHPKPWFCSNRLTSGVPCPIGTLAGQVPMPHASCLMPWWLLRRTWMTAIDFRSLSVGVQVNSTPLRMRRPTTVTMARANGYYSFSKTTEGTRLDFIDRKPGLSSHLQFQHGLRRPFLFLVRHTAVVSFVGCKNHCS